MKTRSEASTKNALGKGTKIETAKCASPMQERALHSTDFGHCDGGGSLLI